jgi:hypothetical protein
LKVVSSITNCETKLCYILWFVSLIHFLFQEQQNKKQDEDEYDSSGSNNSAESSKVKTYGNKSKCSVMSSDDSSSDLQLSELSTSSDEGSGTDSDDEEIGDCVFMSGDSDSCDDDFSSSDDGFIVPDDETIEIYYFDANYDVDEKTYCSLDVSFKKRKMSCLQNDDATVYNKQEWFQFMAKHMQR